MLLTMESKTAAHHKLESLIVKGRTTATEVVEYVMNNQPNDQLARGGDLEFQPGSEGTSITVTYPDSGAREGTLAHVLHRNAVSLARSPEGY
jgi:hypothetical protein